MVRIIGKIIIQLFIFYLICNFIDHSFVCCKGHLDPICPIQVMGSCDQSLIIEQFTK